VLRIVMLAVPPPCRKMRSRNRATSSKESPQEGVCKEEYEEKGISSPFTMEALYTEKRCY
jgi:hypothetical protein